MSTRTSDVTVVGGGVIGCLLAWQLQRRGASVTLLERGEPAHGATWASAGMLLPLGESHRPGPFLALALASMELYPFFARELQEETGIDVEYRAAGRISIAFNDAELEHLRAQHAWHSAGGFDVALLTTEEALALEPAISPRIAGAYLVHNDHQVNNRLLGQAAARAAANAGAHVRTSCEVARLLSESGIVRGVVTTSGEKISSDCVVLTAGAWSNSIGGLPRPVPVRPVRGQMFAVHASPPPVSHLILTERCYLVPRSGRQLLVGATVEEVGFDNYTTARGQRELASALIEAVPGAAELPIAESWSGLRPGSPDEAPILGAEPMMEGLFYATGHYRNGILLSPITASALSELITHRHSSVDLAPFSITRFDAAAGEEIVCERCGAAMYDRHCKVACPNCGYLRDCSDP